MGLKDQLDPYALNAHLLFLVKSIFRGPVRWKWYINSESFELYEHLLISAAFAALTHCLYCDKA